MQLAKKRHLALAVSALALLAGAPLAHAASNTYNVVTTWFEPDTQPKNTIFTGSFTFDDVTHTVTNLSGTLTESMTGVFPMPVNGPNAPYYDQTQVPLTYQLQTWKDEVLGGTFAAVFSKNTTVTFMGNTWLPADGVDVGGVFDGGPRMSNYAKSTQNSYALIFVPYSLSSANNDSNPLTLNWDEKTRVGSKGLASTAYADCAPGGMMGAVCMTATSESVYGAVGTMSGVPLSQSITAVAAVPEPETYAMLLAGLAVVGGVARRRKK
ncbi:MAG: hypothetical protein H6R13_1787 [Proteobacteria bacterium]|nr:hypothetical protein [Pseudomonadota bacterium]